MKSFDCSLYLATDTDLCQGRDLCEIVEEAICAGVALIQLREKKNSALFTYQIGKRLLELTRQYQVPLIINDRVDLMLALDADGVHLGRTDLPLDVGRKLIGDRKIMGYSVNQIEHLEYAIAHDADLVGIGPVFTTKTKKDVADTIGLKGVKRITSQSSIPCVGIGGISLNNCYEVIRAGASGVCMISAILSSTNITETTKEIKQQILAAKKG